MNSGIESFATVLMTIVAILVIVFISINLVDAKGGNPTLGKDLYLEYCMRCHGKYAQGKGPVATEQLSPPANLVQTLRNPLTNDTYLIHQVVLSGKPEQGMPAFKTILSPQDAENIFAYIRALSKRGG
ncbi:MULTISPECIES: c-type cytochrome [Aliagarivorans]|uniref:c-type cytochrome n=1 Tax=Aliagarivorans TaxID=882379 RepID=UPI000402321D|nr:MULTISPECIES: cytochrome c [Aliagarivorans]